MGKLAIAAGIMLMVGIVLAVTLPHARTTAFFAHCSQGWSHRTLADGEDENTIAGMKRAFTLGAPGVEVDVIYVPTEQLLTVISEEALTAGKNPTLSLREVLAAVPPNGRIWLDFWGLARLGEDETRRALEALEGDLHSTDTRQRVLVESQSAMHLQKVSALGLVTSLWINVRPYSDGLLARFADLARAATAFKSGSFSAVSIESGQYGEDVGWLFWKVPILLFTVNKRADFERLASKPNIRIILTDRAELFGQNCSATN
jgi:hypothetical protein